MSPPSAVAGASILEAIGTPAASRLTAIAAGSLRRTCFPGRRSAAPRLPRAPGRRRRSRRDCRDRARRRPPGHPPGQQLAQLLVLGGGGPGVGDPMPPVAVDMTGIAGQRRPDEHADELAPHRLTAVDGHERRARRQRSPAFDPPAAPRGEHRRRASPSRSWCLAWRCRDAARERRSRARGAPRRPPAPARRRRALPPDRAVAERLGKRRLVDDRSARRVDQHRGLLHQRRRRRSIRCLVSAVSGTCSETMSACPRSASRSSSRPARTGTAPKTRDEPCRLAPDPATAHDQNRFAREALPEHELERELPRFTPSHEPVALGHASE